MNNVDQKEQLKFESQASIWWDLKGPCRPLHDLNPTRLQFITDHVLLAGKQVLDLGCGAGILSESLAKKGAFVTGIDVSLPLIEAAKAHADLHPDDALPFKLSERLNYQVATAETFTVEHQQYFDVIVCMELLEHVPDPLSLIQACAKMIKPQGHLFFSTLNRTLKSYCLAILAAEKIFKILPNGTHEYKKFIRPQELSELLRKTSLKLIELKGMNYNPFTHRANLTNDVSVNYLAYVGNL